MYPNKIDTFTEKLNRLEGNTYVIEEEITITNGMYESELQHDNISLSSINVYTGPKLTGKKIQNFILSTPSCTPWKKIIKIFSEVDKCYITYETQGDTVEAEDINEVQESIVNTQKTLNSEIDRSTNAEKIITDNLSVEVSRAIGAEQTLTNNLNTEIARAKGSENILTDNLNSEINRSKSTEKVLTDNLSAEINRSKENEDTLSTNINQYKESNNAEIQMLKEKDSDLNNRKAEKTYVDIELNKRYLKEQVFTKEEVLQKIQNVIGTAPQALDTLQEIAKSLNNDSDFAGTITKQLANKVDKVQGKQLSTEDYTTSEKEKLAGVEANANKYIHPGSHSADMVVENINKRFVSDVQKTVLSNTSGTNTGDETNSSIKSKLGITTLSGINTGDQDLSGLVLKTTMVNGHALSGGITVTKSDIGLANVTNDAQVKRSEMGVASGVATLDSAGKTVQSPAVHSHDSLTISNNNEINIADGFNYDEGTVYLNYRGANKPIKNVRICTGDGKANSFASLQAKTFVDANGNEVAYKKDVASAGYGDMLKSIYDKNSDGIIDKADDSNTVGGKKPSDFASSSFGLGTVCQTATVDWNNYKTTGFFMGYNLLNECPGGGWQFCIVMRHNDIWTSQTMIDFQGTSMYQRNQTNGIWGSWRKILITKQGITWNDLKGV